MEKNKNIYLDTYVLQQDMRIRLPKQVISNLGVTKGQTMFDIFMDPEDGELILRISEKNRNGEIN